MDTIQSVPQAMTTEVFYDVSNPSYHHHHSYPHHITAATTQDGYWPPSSQRTTSGLDHHPALSGVKCDEGADAPPVLSNYSSDRKVGASSAPTARKHSEPADCETGRHKTTKVWKEDEEEKRRDAPPEVEDMASPKENQVAATLKWLTENYELSDGVCLPRCVLYVHYLDFCKRQGFKPAGAATFGKLIRQKFKNITTRRLGTRGQSKYHYYGIGIIESSIYYQSVYTGKGLTRFSGIKIKTEGSSRKYSLSSKTGTLLPEFPSATNLILPDEETTEKMTTFLMMYRTHSQRILDTVITANFEEIQNLLVHFWQGYPQHLQDVLRLPVTRDVVAICDSILYTVLTDVLVPNAIQDLPESLSTDLRAFLKSLPHWLQNSLDDLIPETIRNVKQEVLQQFLRSMTRQVAFIKMAQTARPQLATLDVTARALSDLDMIDFGQMCAQASFALNEKSLVNSDIARHVFEDLKSLIQKQSQIESYTEWIDSLVDKCVLQQDDTLPSKFKHRAGRFLLQWSMFGALVMKDLTLNNAHSFSFLHLMKMTLDEYVLLVMETQTDKLRDAQLQKNLQIHMKNAEEIKMSAKIRTQANKLLTSPKARKRKVEDQGESGDEIEPTVRSEENCTTFHTPPAVPYYEPVTGTAFSRPLPLSQAPRDVSNIDSTPPVTSQCGDLLRSTTLNSNPLALSPIKHYPSYDRNPYLPAAFSFNSYSDYVNHTTFGSQRQMQGFPDPTPPTSAQPFHPMTFNSGVSSTPSAPTAYWADTRGHHHSALGDPYSQLGYSSYQQTYDTYKKSSLLRGSMYQDSLPRPAATTDGLSRTGPTLDGLTRTNPLLDSLARPTPSFDASRSAMYYTRPTDNYQVGSSLTVGSYGNSFMEITPPSGQYHRQDGLLYQEDVFTSNMAAASGLAGFPKSYLPAGFR